ncbi:sensor histidine kinase [Haliangium sp.]|uniref:sensor histidine kinase n=1 Tax=Haliangium sp. TaxID=2663208 RepID=UPI003D0AD152
MSASDDAATQIDVLSLGILHEAILSFAGETEVERFWDSVCKNARWIVPSRRMCVAVRADDGVSVPARYQGGRAQAPVLGPVPIRGVWARALAARTVEWITPDDDDDDDDGGGDEAGAGEVAAGVAGAPGLGRDEVVDWLLEGHDGALLCAPLLAGPRPLGTMLFAVAAAMLREKTRIGAMATFYARHAATHFTLVETTAALAHTSHALEARNQELQTTLDRLVETQAQLVQAGKLAAIGTFVAGVSHELNNPVTVILGFAQSLLRRTPTDAFTRTAVEQIASHAQRCADLTRALLDFSRPGTGARVPGPPGPMVDRAVALAAAQARKHRVSIDRRPVETALPAVSMCTSELESAVLNVIGNAIDASPEGAAVTVTLAAQAHGPRAGIEVAVADQGPGIAAEALARVFDPFFTTKPEGRGTGLGLSLTRQIVESHGGHISLDSDPDRGTVVRIWLPGADSEDGA